MEFLIGVFIVLVVAMLIKSGRKSQQRDKTRKPSVDNAAQVVADKQRKEAVDELITVVLPTINNDK